jgi:ribosomal protein S6--L-glutamate ligase
MLRNAVKNFGHKHRIIREDKCQIYFTRTRPKLLYAGKPFPKVDVVIPRFSALSNVQLRATILQQLESLRIPVIQSYISVVRAKNKLRTLQLLTEKHIPVPRTIVVQRFEYLDTAIRRVGGFPIILKTPFGSLGKGVAIVESRRALHSAFDLLLTSPDFTSILIQEYVKEAKGKDIRVFIVDGKILTAMERVAAKGDFRSNLAQGGEGKLVNLTKEEEKISLAAAKALNLGLAGVDILRSKHGPVIMEVNCNPGIEGISKISGINIAEEIVKYSVKFAKSYK